MVKTIAIFNFKGGVGKTTFAINLGAQLAKKKRVLLIDADPQCNLTSYFSNTQNENQDQDESECDQNIPEIETDEDNISQQSFSINENHLNINVPCDKVSVDTRIESCKPISGQSENLYDCIYHIFAGTGSLITPNTLNNFRGTNLYLLPGSPSIIEFEGQLSDSVNIVFDVIKNGCFGRLLDSLNQKYNFDYIFVDCAPSSGTFNRSIILNCDYILPPAFADEFSCQSTEQLLKHLLPSWFNWANRVRDSDYKRINTRGYDTYFIKSQNPKILPIIVQNYKLRSQRITKAFSRWINHLESVIENIDKTWINDNMISLNNNKRVIPLIPNAGQLVVVSGEISIPLPFMNATNVRHPLWSNWAERNTTRFCERLDGFIRVLERLD